MRFLSPLLAVFLAACAMNDATNKHLAPPSPPEEEATDNHPPPPMTPRTTSELTALAEMRALECQITWRIYQWQVRAGRDPIEIMQGALAERIKHAGEAVLTFLEEHPGHDQLVRSWKPEQKDWENAPGYVQMAFYNCFITRPRATATPGGSCKVTPTCSGASVTQH